MNRRVKKLLAEIEEDTSLKLSNLEEVKFNMLNNSESKIRSSICFLCANNNIFEVQHEMVLLLCDSKSYDNSSTIVYSIHQFKCSKYFAVFIAILLDNRYFMTCLECYSAIRKCKNVSLDDLNYAFEAISAWCYFHESHEFIGFTSKTNKLKLMYEIGWYLKSRINREKRKK